MFYPKFLKGGQFYVNSKYRVFRTLSLHTNFTNCPEALYCKEFALQTVEILYKILLEFIDIIVKLLLIY